MGVDVSEPWIELSKKFSQAMSGHSKEDAARACGWLLAQIAKGQNVSEFSVTLARALNVASQCEGRDFLSQ